MDGLRLGFELHTRFEPACGRVGIFASAPAGVFAVTSSHVVGFREIGHSQPMLSKLSLAESGKEAQLCGKDQTLGQTIWCSELRPGKPVVCDFALVRLSDKPLADLPEKLGQPADYLRADQKLEPNITKVAMIVGDQLRRGTYLERLTENRRVDIKNYTGEEIRYQGLHRVEYDKNTDAGMSGAAVIGVDPPLRGVVLGIHVGGNDKAGFFQRLDSLWVDARFKLFRN